MTVMEKNIVSVSGGKDSTAMLLLAIERETPELQAVFADTGNEHPQTYEYVRYLERETGVPIQWVRADFTRQIEGKAQYVREKWSEKGVPAVDVERALLALKPTGNPFLDLCIWKGRFPSSKARFCSEELKRNPIIEQVQMPLLDAGNEVISWQGVRADESPSRARLQERECVGTWPDTGGELWNYRPILKWTAQQCFDMHKRHGIKHNPLYEQGMGRVGCMPCINARKDELLEISKRFPEEIERIAEWERIVAQASKKMASTFFAGSNAKHRSGSIAHLTPAEIVKIANVWQAVEWAKTSRGGVQYDMLRVQDEGPLCSSIYGLCE